MAEQPRTRSTTDLLTALAEDPSPAVSSRFADDLEARLLAVAETLPPVEVRPGDRVVALAPKPWVLSPAAWAVAALILVAIVVGPRFLAADGVRLDDAIMATVTLPDGTVLEAADGLTVPDGSIIEVGEDGEVTVGAIVLLPGSRARVVDGTVVVIAEPTPAESGAERRPAPTEVSGSRSTSADGPTSPVRGEERRAGAAVRGDGVRPVTDRGTVVDSGAAADDGDGASGSSSSGAPADRPGDTTDRPASSSGSGSAGDQGPTPETDPGRSDPDDTGSPPEAISAPHDDARADEGEPDAEERGSDDGQAEPRPTRDPGATEAEGDADGAGGDADQPPVAPSDPVDAEPTRPPTRHDDPPAAPVEDPVPSGDPGADGDGAPPPPSDDGGTPEPAPQDPPRSPDR